MKSQFRHPDFSVVVWIKMNEHFATVRSAVLAAADKEPYETTEFQGMSDFHWAFGSFEDARKFADSLKVAAQRPQVLLLRIMSMVDGVESISIKDERVARH